MEFRRDVVAVARRGEAPIKQIAADFGIAESCLRNWLRDADVVVIGLKDEQWGRRVHAIVEPADLAEPPTADEMIAYAKARLAAYKVPKTVEFVDAMPRSAATKVNRGRLVEERGG